jgi:hypothetical protein
VNIKNYFAVRNVCRFVTIAQPLKAGLAHGKMKSPVRDGRIILSSLRDFGNLLDAKPSVKTLDYFRRKILDGQAAAAGARPGA